MTAAIPGWVNPNVKGYDPGKRKRCVNVAWRNGRHVRIKECPFGYVGKVAAITGVNETFIYVHIKLGRKPHEWDAVAYLPKNLRLI
jgi:hypothetical protein